MPAPNSATVPRFTGLFLPARLMQAEMNILDKVLLVQIEALSRRDQGCTATNAYLATTFGVSESTISRAVGRLEALGLVVATYAADNQRTLRLTRRACEFWLPDIEAGDAPDPSRRNAYTSRRNAQQKLEEEVEEESDSASSNVPSPDLYSEQPSIHPDGILSPSRARDQGTGWMDGDEEKALLAELMALGIYEVQSRDLLKVTQIHGRPRSWLRDWIARAREEAKNPGAYLRRIIEANRDLPAPRQPSSRPRDGEESYADPYNRPVSPERAAKIQSRADAEWERTCRENEERRQGRPPTDEELAECGWFALKEQLARELTGTEIQRQPRLTPMTDDDRETMAAVRAELARRREGVLR